MNRLAALAIALVPLAGCSAPPHAVDWRAEGTQLAYPDSYQTLQLRGVTVDEIAAVGTVADALPGERLPIDRSLIRQNVCDAIRGMGLFREVTDLDGNQAASNGLILDLAFENAALVHAGENEDARLAFWLWFFTGLPGLSIRDQLYEFRADARAQVIDAATGDVLVPWESLTSQAQEPWALNFHERTSGVFAYVKTPVIPPSSIAIDEREILREILPATLRPPIQRLVQLLNEIRFVPVNRVEFHPVTCPGVRIESIRAPRAVASDENTTVVNLSLVLWIDEGLRALKEVRVGGQQRLDLEEVRKVSTRARAELALGELALQPGDEVYVELVLESTPGPQRVLVIRSVPTSDVHPERRP